MTSLSGKKRLADSKQMPIGIVRLFLCLGAAGLTLLAYIEKQNELTELRLAIPALAKELKSIEEENTRLTYEIERFESPVHLMELMRKPEYSHLKYPYLDEEVFLPKHAPFPRGTDEGGNL